MSYVSRVGKRLFSWTRFIDSQRLSKMYFCRLSRRGLLHCNASFPLLCVWDGMLMMGRIGATTENPSFKITSALLSRCRVFVLSPLTTDHVKQILKRAHTTLCDDQGVHDIVSDELVDYLADLADGDGISCRRCPVIVARNALNMFELTFSLALTASQKNDPLTVATLRPLLLRTQIVYDRAGDKHYDTISAFIKSMRGSGISCPPPIN